MQTTATILSNDLLQGDYHILNLALPLTAEMVTPGQFVHLQIPGLDGRLLRRPFSIFQCTANGIRILYKVVGIGTEQLAKLPPNTTLELLAPLGNGFSPLPEDALLIAGGYGCAPLFELAKRYHPRGILIGGRSSGDILLRQEYEELGCPVLVSTDDGSDGRRGRVTELLEDFLQENTVRWIASCGPLPMLYALIGVMEQHGIAGEISLDSAMCCGVGACFSCVAKIKDASAPEGWSYKRICHDGPVFPATSICTE